MERTADFEFNIPAKQEAGLAFQFEEDVDLWLVLLSRYIETKGKTSEDLIRGLIENSAAFQKLTEEVKNKGYDDLIVLSRDRTLQWNMQLRKMLSDPAHAFIMRFYFKNIIALKTKKGAQIGARGQLQKKINEILSHFGNEAYTSLENYIEATRTLITGKTPSGNDLNENIQTYIVSKQNDNLKHICLMLTLILGFKFAKKYDDIQKLQDFIRNQMIKPLEATVIFSKLNGNDTRTKIKSYYKLIEAIDITFD
ncbi:MAG: hypothetical protein JEZ06_05185 [Anaerolineaceae bacterium]|nr:hypothetical protein [Anaerolineaceae bacterium]